MNKSPLFYLLGKFNIDNLSLDQFNLYTNIKWAAKPFDTNLLLGFLNIDKDLRF